MKYSILFLIFITNSAFSQFSDTVIIRNHLVTITKTQAFRNHKNIEQLNNVANYIHQHFQQYTDSVSFQEFQVDGKIYKNVICSFGTQHQKRIVIGAHYDVCGNQEGADDNATGVAGLLELARLLHNNQLNYRIDLVAYSLEEPPYFRSENMGSYVHAKSLSEMNADVYGMICLEMIGYFSDEKKSQDYPLAILKLFYGSKGNYITLVKKYGAGNFAKKYSRKYKATKAIRTKKFTGPEALQGIDFSDHRNYWKFGYSAVMITNTAFYRNKNYHQTTDKMETLDLPRMSKVIDGVYQTLLKL